MNHNENEVLAAEQTQRSVSGRSDGIQKGPRLPWHTPGFHQIGVEEVKTGGTTHADATFLS